MLTLPEVTKPELKKSLAKYFGKVANSIKISKYQGHFKIVAQIYPASDRKVDPAVIDVTEPKTSLISLKSTYFHKHFHLDSVDNLAYEITSAIVARIDRMFTGDCEYVYKRRGNLLDPDDKKGEACLKYYQDYESIKELIHSLKTRVMQESPSSISLANTLGFLIVVTDDKHYDAIEKQIRDQQMLGALVPGKPVNRVQIFVLALETFARAKRFSRHILVRLAKLGINDGYDKQYGLELANMYRTNLAVKIGVDEVAQTILHTTDGSKLIAFLVSSPDEYLNDWEVANHLVMELDINNQTIVDTIQHMIVE